VPHGLRQLLSTSVLTAGALLGIRADAATLSRVQSGTTAITSGSAVRAVPITAVNRNASFLVFSAAVTEGATESSTTTGQITADNELTFRRLVASSSAVAISWYVMEFSSGVVVQRGSAAVSSSSTTDVPITSTSLATSFPLVTFRNAGSGMGDSDFFRSTFSSTTNLRLLANRAPGTGSTAEWQVVSMDNVNVNAGTTTISSGATSTSPSATVDPAKTLLLYGYTFDNAGTNTSAENMVRGRIPSSSQLSFDRSAAGQATLSVHFFRVAFTDATGVQHASEPFTSSQTTRDVTIAPVDLSRSFAVAGYLGRTGRANNTTSDNPGPAWFTATFTSSTTLRLTRAEAGAAADVGWFVVSFPPPGVPPDTTVPSIDAPLASPTPNNTGAQRIFWTATDPGGSGINSLQLERSDNGGAFTPVAALTGAVTSWTQIPPVTEGSYAYRVLATDVAGNTATSAASETVVVDQTAPVISAASAEQALVASAPHLLFWEVTDAGGSGLDTMVIERRDASGGFQVMASVPATDRTLSVMPALQTATYRLTATDRAGNLSAGAIVTRSFGRPTLTLSCGATSPERAPGWILVCGWLSARVLRPHSRRSATGRRVSPPRGGPA
jgi:hypothetical protein